MHRTCQTCDQLLNILQLFTWYLVQRLENRASLPIPHANVDSCRCTPDNANNTTQVHIRPCPHRTMNPYHICTIKTSHTTIHTNTIKTSHTTIHINTLSKHHTTIHTNTLSKHHTTIHTNTIKTSHTTIHTNTLSKHHTTIHTNTLMSSCTLHM